MCEWVDAVEKAFHSDRERLIYALETALERSESDRRRLENGLRQIADHGTSSHAWAWCNKIAREALQSCEAANPADGSNTGSAPGRGSPPVAGKDETRQDGQTETGDDSESRPSAGSVIVVGHVDPRSDLADRLLDGIVMALQEFTTDELNAIADYREWVYADGWMQRLIREYVETWR